MFSSVIPPQSPFSCMKVVNQIHGILVIVLGGCIGILTSNPNSKPGATILECFDNTFSSLSFISPFDFLT